MGGKGDLMETALVTGGAGFIGSHVVDVLIGRGYRTIVVDNLFSGKKENVNSQAEFHYLDICSPELKEIFTREKISWVFHLAAQIDVSRSVIEPQWDAKVNILGLINVLENCRVFNVRGIVFASSVAIYGESHSLPVRETTPKGPFSPYGVSKLTSEYYLYYYHRIHGLPYVALRYSNVFGPRQSIQGEAGVVAKFLGKMLDGETCTIFGDGESIRDYVFVEDVARANLAAIDKIRHLPMAASIDDRAFNIATGLQTSVTELFKSLKELTGYKGEPRYAPVRKGDLNKSYQNIDHARQILGWEPSLNLAEGLKKTFNYWKIKDPAIKTSAENSLIKSP